MIHTYERFSVPGSLSEPRSSPTGTTTGFLWGFLSQGSLSSFCMRVICISDTGGPTGGGKRVYFFSFKFVVSIKGRYVTTCLAGIVGWVLQASCATVLLQAQQLNIISSISISAGRRSCCEGTPFPLQLVDQPFRMLARTPCPWLVGLLFSFATIW